MFRRPGVVLLLAVVLASWALLIQPTPACCPVSSGKPVVNADQTVILIWDAATHTEHFIRKASFKSDADDFGFLVPTPNQPELEESGNEAFPYLQKLTEPVKETRPRPKNMSCGCGVEERSMVAGNVKQDSVNVRAEKDVAGFHAVVLEASSATKLVGWLKENGYPFSPAVEAWAKPYIELGWMITALKMAKPKGNETKDVNAAALRLSFNTDRPLFPYREPNSDTAAQALGARSRLLRIYFVAEGRYAGELTKEVPWTGMVAWSDKLSAEARRKTLELLKLPTEAGPAEWWLTEFEDNWPYRVAPADLYFAHDADQKITHRPPIIQYVDAWVPTDVTVYALAAVVVLPSLLRRVRRRGEGR